MDHEFKDPLPLARVVGIALIVWLVGVAAGAGSSLHSLLTIQAFQGGGAGNADLERVDMITGITAFPFIAVNLVAIVLVARWIYRVNKNAHALSDSVEMTPGWNVGFFFVPILNLWKPFMGIREVWRASVAPGYPQEVAVPGWLAIWWICWIISNILNNFAFRMGTSADTLEEIVSVDQLSLLIVPFDLISGALLWVLVRRLSRIQHNARDAEAQQAIFE